MPLLEITRLVRFDLAVDDVFCSLCCSCDFVSEIRLRRLPGGDPVKFGPWKSHAERQSGHLDHARGAP